MNLLDSILQLDADIAFGDTDAFAEVVVFIPRRVVHGTGTASIIGGQVAGVSVGSPGSNYTYPPPVLLEGGGGYGAAVVANISGGFITGFTVTSPGQGYTSAPTVVVGGVAACVQRDPPYDPTNSNAPRVKMMVSLPVSKVPSIDSGGDKVNVAYRIGATPADYLVSAPVNQDAGFWKVAVG